MDKILPGRPTRPYFSLPQAEGEGEEQQRRRQLQRRAWPPGGWTTTFWAFMALFFASTTTWLAAELHAVRKHGSFATGFRRELGPSALPAQKRGFPS